MSLLAKPVFKNLEENSYIPHGKTTCKEVFNLYFSTKLVPRENLFFLHRKLDKYSVIHLRHSYKLPFLINLEIIQAKGHQSVADWGNI